MNIPQDLRFGELIYQASHKPESHATFAGIYHGESVVIKRGDSNLHREEAVLRAVNYEGIPDFIGYFAENGQAVLVMQQIPGVSLSQYIELDDNWQSRELPIKEVIRIVDGLAQCFEALHKVGYLYRDLNLAHVIVSETRIGLIDHEWCVKLDISGSGRVDSQAGTWETMAPEEFGMDNIITRTSNTYTLGTVLLQLTAREDPFFVSPEEIPHSGSQRQRAKELHQELPSIRTGNSEIDRVLYQALQPEPSKRYKSVTEFREALILKK